MPIKLVREHPYLVTSSEQSLHYYERLVGKQVLYLKHIYNNAVEVRIVGSWECHMVFEEDLAESTENCDYTFLLKESML